MDMRSIRVTPITIIIPLALLIGGSCKCPTESLELPVTLELVSTGLTTANLKVTVEGSGLRHYQLYRDGAIVISDTLTALDTVVTDKYLKPNTTYSYRAYSLYNGSIIDSSALLSVATMDTTSHEFIWEVDSIGYFQSGMDGVWGINATDVYVVGTIHSADGQYRSIVHWVDSNWTELDYSKGFLADIFGFGTQDIWVVGSNYIDGVPYAIIGHWNGDTWQTWNMYEHGTLRDIWGTSSNNVYAVGHDGLILHYDGNSWEPQSSGTTQHLVDIWGINANSIYATGGSYSTGAGVVLHYSDNEWSIIYDEPINPTGIGGFASTIWGESDEFLFVDIGPNHYYGAFGSFQRIFPPTSNTFIEKIRGSGENNIFMVGHFGMVVHWNGSSWHRFEEFFSFSQGASLGDVWVFEDEVFIAGSADWKGIIYHGIRK